MTTFSIPCCLRTSDSKCLLTCDSPLTCRFSRTCSVSFIFDLSELGSQYVLTKCCLETEALAVDVMGRYFHFPLAVSRWRFAEFQYLQPGPPRRLQTVVVYLPDIWTIMPTLEEWEALCQQKAAEAAPAAQEVPVVRPRQTSGGTLCPDAWAQVVNSSWLLSQETEPTEQAADASEQAADTSKQNAENPEVTAQQEMDTDLPEAPPPPLEPAVMARSGCINLSLHGIVEDRRPKERISFEVGVGVWGA